MTGTVESRESGFARAIALVALAVVALTVVYMLLASGGGGTTYKLQFETGGQLVPGNEVLIGGRPVGSVDAVELGDDAQAEITIEVERALHQGTTAVIRSTSLSGIANRYVSLFPGADNAPELESGSVIPQDKTTSAVDIDQLFDTFDEPTRRGLQNLIQGFATSYDGRGAEANLTYRYLSPSLTAVDKLVQEVNRDSRVLGEFLSNGSRVVTAIAERRDDLAGIVSNSNQALGAIASQNDSLDRALGALPPALRQANTTFANLRPALDSLDPLIETTGETTKDLAPFLRGLRQVLNRSDPVFDDLSVAVNISGPRNDLADAAGELPALRKRADSAVEPAVAALQSADPVLRFTRPYTPDLLGALAGLNAAAGFYDLNGHYVRALPSGMGIFDYNDGTGVLDPIPSSQQFDEFGPFGGPNFKVFHRCPGGSTQVIAGSNPFLDAGGLTTPAPPGDCTATDVPQGP